jgi:hypothetical protein
VSVESLAIALHHSRAKGTAKLVLIGIANHDGDGGAWPSVATLAHYAGVDARNVQRALDRLVTLGEIRRDVQAGGDHRVPDHRRPNRYRFLLECPHTCDRTRNHRTRNRGMFEPDQDNMRNGVAPASPGDESATGGVAPASPKPSSNQTTTDDPLERRVSNAREPMCHRGHRLLDDAEVCILGHYSPEREAHRLAEQQEQRR